MSAINFVVRDSAGNLQRGAVAGEDASNSIIVGEGADISLNLTRGQIVAYTRQGQALEITLLDGRVIVIEGFFAAGGAVENQLFLSADGYLAEVELTQGAGEDYYAHYAGVGQNEKFALNDDLYFMRSSDVMLADNYVPADDEVGMLGQVFGAGLSPLLGLGGAAVGTAAVAGIVGEGGGGDGDGDDGPQVAITSGTSGAGDVVNEEDYADGVDLAGTATPGAEITVVIDGVTRVTTADEDGNWDVVYEPGALPDGTYETGVSVTATNEGGSATATDTLVVDTELDLTFDSDAVEGDGTVNLVESEDGVTLTGTVEAGSAVVVTIAGVDYTATVTGGTWSVDLDPGVIGPGEYDQPVTVTAMDAVGNVTSLTDSVTVDTETHVTLNAFTAGTDAIVNGSEHEAGVTLTGTAQPGASVLVVLGGMSQTVTATEAGTWQASWAGAQLPTGETTMDVSVTATDGAGNTAQTTGSVEIDTYVNELTVTSGEVGGDGVVNFDESGLPITVTGTVEAGSVVMVTLHEAQLQADVAADGSWSVTFPAGALPGGEYPTSMVVEATDAAGNTTSMTEAVQVDTVAGDVALSSAPIEIDDVINADEASDGVWISGTATPGLLVTVGFGGTEQAVYADAQGNWSVKYDAADVPADTDAALITASISDAAGNFKEVSDTVAIDTVVEPFAFSSAPVEGDGIVATPDAQDGIVLSGSVEPHSQVVVEFGGESHTVQAGGDGQWSATFSSSSVRQDEYAQAATATATDPAGNVREITMDVEVDTIVNTLTADGPVEGDDVVNRQEASDGITLTGAVEAGSTVLVEFNGIARQATVTGDSWSVDFTPDEVGADEYDATVTITATDSQGNEAQITDSFHVDTTTPDVPGVETVVLTPDGVQSVGIGASANTQSVTEIESDGDTGATYSNGDDMWGQTFFDFDRELPDGSHLVVTEADTAGNANSTFLMLEETGPNAVDLSGLEGFDIGAIDLSFAKDTTLTLDAQTLKDLSDVNDDLIVHGDFDDKITLEGGAETGTTTVIDGKTYDIYTMGDEARVFIEDGVDVTTVV
ncbi:MAG: hypothetical protein GVY31_05600 [Alphaproteobacteria bacterium]|jgi:hypothetical protein|nr:hypothetical protein [Alphaproteobacteria bacterium]